jgi:aminoglycoside phosphotransferase (APT) family kinase protein
VSSEIDVDQQKQRFEDGNISAVVRIGDTVHRATGPWTPAVHALLRHVERRGFDAAPRPLGTNAQGREVLSYIAGRTAPASLDNFRTEAVLAAVARLARRYHDATAGFQAPPDAAWQFTVGAPRAGEVICHNDIGPWNVVFDGLRPVGLIDWDFAAPAPREWDIAYALWRFVPLYAGAEPGALAERARRIRIFCDAYGLADRRGLLATIERRQQVLLDTLEQWGQAGVPGFAAMLRDGHADGIRSDIAELRQHHGLLAALVE